jgi:lipopolysaccharide export system ATP-binding protein
MKLYTSGLVKQYGKRTVVKGVSVEVNQGEIVGLLGPNGAGKTTTFYMIVGLIKPTRDTYILMMQRLPESQFINVLVEALVILLRKSLYFKK